MYRHRVPHDAAAADRADCAEQQLVVDGARCDGWPLDGALRRDH